MTIAVVLDDARLRVAVLAGSLGGLVDLDALGRKLRRRLTPRTIYVLDGVRWVAEEEAIRLIVRAGRDKLLDDLAAALAQARLAAVRAIDERGRQAVLDAGVLLDRARELHEEVAVAVRGAAWQGGGERLMN